VLYATDLALCPVEEAFTGQQVRAAIAGHVLAEAALTGTYSLNRRCAEVQRTSSSSTSNTSEARGGMTPPAPLSP